MALFLTQKAFNNMKLPSVFHEQQNLEHIKWRTLNMTCPKPIPKSHHCILLPVPLNTSYSYIWDNHTLSMTGYKLVKLHNMSKFLEQKDLGIKWYYFNSKTQTVLYYDPKTKHIRYVPRYYYALPISHRDKSHSFDAVDCII